MTEITEETKQETTDGAGGKGEKEGGVWSVMTKNSTHSSAQ